MKCDKCPFAPTKSEAGDYDDCLIPEEEQVEFKDGSWGCRKSTKQLTKLAEEYAEYLGAMGEDMGIEGDFTARGWNLIVGLSRLMHIIGMWPEGVRHTYSRHGKMFYRPYRNYWCGYDRYLEYFSGSINIVEKIEPDGPGGRVWYKLTDHGRIFLGRHLRMTIHPEED